MLNIKIDDFELPIEMIAGFSQDYTETNNETVHIAIDGTAYVQSSWSKLSTNISGSGWIPPVFSSSGISHVLKCAAPLQEPSNSNVITIPRAFRTDEFHAPKAYAFKDGSLVETTYSISSSTVTINIVSGAEYYVVQYIPILTVRFSSPNKQSLDSGSSTYAWSITAIEV